MFWVVFVSVGGIWVLCYIKMAEFDAAQTRTWFRVNRPAYDAVQTRPWFRVNWAGSDAAQARPWFRVNWPASARCIFFLVPSHYDWTNFIVVAGAAVLACVVASRLYIREISFFYIVCHHFGVCVGNVLAPGLGPFCCHGWSHFGAKIGAILMPRLGTFL